MVYEYLIPPRIKKKRGIFGAAKTTDILIAGAMAFTGLTIMLIIGGFLGMTFMVAFIGGAYLLFLMTDKYGENARIRIERSLKFARQQKVFYWYRTFHSPIYLNKQPHKDPDW